MEGGNVARPGLEAGPWNLEDGSHGDSHGSPVKGISALRRHEDGVHSESGRTAERGADVRMVDEVFQDDDATRRGAAVSGCEQLIKAGKDGTLHGGQGAAM